MYPTSFDGNLLYYIVRTFCPHAATTGYYAISGKRREWVTTITQQPQQTYSSKALAAYDRTRLSDEVKGFANFASYDDGPESRSFDQVRTAYNYFWRRAGLTSKLFASMFCGVHKLLRIFRLLCKTILGHELLHGVEIVSRVSTGDIDNGNNSKGVSCVGCS